MFNVRIFWYERIDYWVLEGEKRYKLKVIKLSCRDKFVGIVV